MLSGVNRNLQIGFGFSLLLLIISSVASYTSIKSLLNSADEIGHTTTVIQHLENTLSAMKDAETGQRGFLLTGDEAFLEPYNGAYTSILTSLNQFKSLSNGSALQQRQQKQLRDILMTRLGYLQKLINKKKEDNIVSTSDLEQGKRYMDEARIIVNQMKAHEEQLLTLHNASMDRFTNFVPFLIVLAAFLSLVITVFSYIKVNHDFAEKARLQNDLVVRDLEIKNRINVIQNLAEQISAGNYELRINENEKDGLGNLALSLDRMAGSLQESFSLLDDKEWLQSGVAQLNGLMVGEKEIQTLTSDIVEFIAGYTNSQVAALYLVQENSRLKLEGSYAFAHQNNRDYIKFGEGLTGQSASSGKEMLLTDISPDNLSVSFASGEVKPGNILALPIFYDNLIEGVLEIASVKPFSKSSREFISSVMPHVGIAINSLKIRRVQQELLEQTQIQAEELQAKHNELENINSELEAQSRKIQASEEELRVQQEELLQSNLELNEKSRLLEEKNQLIVERNLDIQQKSHELELSTKYKSEFLANMSHELRTPLNSILLLSRLMSENKDLDAEQVEYAQVIQNAGQGLLSLIDEILDLSKIEAGKMDLEYEGIKLQEIASSMQDLFEPLSRQKSLQLRFIVDKNAPEIITSDRMRLEQILKNLLSNAIKFTTDGYVELSIVQAKDSPYVHFKVKDTGIGIPNDKQSQVFEAFQQADGSTRRKFGGTGLGLSISKELAKLLGGEILLKSKAGEGSEFTLIIPATGILTSDQSHRYPVHVTADLKFLKQSKDFKDLNIPPEIADDRHHIMTGDRVILIIEDDTNFAKALMDFSKSQGFKCITTVRGDLGISMAMEYKPLAILLDIQLPAKNGWEVMQELKQNPQTRHIPVHIMSSLEAKRESLLKGAVDFISKPVAIEQMTKIFAKLEDALSRHPKKVLIVEEDPKHAKALGYFLATFNINSEISGNVSEGINLLQKKEVDCVILDMGVPDQHTYETLERFKKTPGLEALPIIIFTGKHLSIKEEKKIKHYADSIVVKTAHSYQRILDEVALFLHVVADYTSGPPIKNKNLLAFNEVLQQKTVLIVDDDVRNIFSITKALEKFQMNIVSATDGKEALKQLAENPQVDIVLMDMMMPEMDGYESTSLIRQNPKYKNLPVLAVTAKTMKGDREKCIIAGASDYITKPVDIDQMVSLLRVWLYDSAVNPVQKPVDTSSQISHFTSQSTDEPQ